MQITSHPWCDNPCVRHCWKWQYFGACACACVRLLLYIQLFISYYSCDDDVNDENYKKGVKKVSLFIYIWWEQTCATNWLRNAGGNDNLNAKFIIFTNGKYPLIYGMKCVAVICKNRFDLSFCHRSCLFYYSFL